MCKKAKEWLKLIPSVDSLLKSSKVKTWLKEYPRAWVISSLRDALDSERNCILAGVNPGSRDEIVKRVLQRGEEILSRKRVPSLRRVINGTGVILHTNLGRAILPEDAIKRVYEIATHYSNLEFDLEKGVRGKRDSHLICHITELTGAEDTLVVNNNAAAVLLLLDTFAKGREVIVSRGELIEIGGSFRLPDILKKSGAILREVGCTNKTYLHDYEEAINENTAILLKTHKSNYSIEGFSRDVSGKEISRLAKRYNLISAEDMGSGLLIDLSSYGLHGEPTVRDLIKDGLDIVNFSGDKLLGGPQAGIIVGRRDLISKMRKNPLARAFRLDKMTISALEATLNIYRDPVKARSKVPFLQMLSATPSEILKRELNFIERLKVNLPQEGVKVILGDMEGFSKVGGGAFPTHNIPTHLLSIEVEERKPEDVKRALLSSPIPIVSRIEENKVVLDFRTIMPEEEEDLLKSIKHALERL